jgi:hypothetical protein
VPIISQEIYHSANGDHWHLIDDGRSNQIFVRHEANLPSGGCVTDTNIADFLNVNGSGPEYATLQDIIRQGLAGSISDRVKKIVAKHLKLADSDVTPEASL